MKWTNIGKVLIAVPRTQYGFSKRQLFIKLYTMTATAHQRTLAQFVGGEGERGMETGGQHGVSLMLLVLSPSPEATLGA